MAKAKMIKEVEVKFSPAFDKAINGVKTTKKTKKVTAKTKTAKPKTKKATAKAPTKTKTKTRVATPKATGPKAPRGYKIEKVERQLTLDGVKDSYELYELTGKKLAEPKRFISYEHAVKYIGTLENEILQTKALSGKVHGGMLARGIMAETKDLAAQADLPELDTELPERCDKTSIEDIDA